VSSKSVLKSKLSYVHVFSRRRKKRRKQQVRIYRILQQIQGSVFYQRTVSAYVCVCVCFSLSSVLMRQNKEEEKTRK